MQAALPFRLVVLVSVLVILVATASQPVAGQATYAAPQMAPPVLAPAAAQPVPTAAAPAATPPGAQPAGQQPGAAPVAMSESTSQLMKMPIRVVSSKTGEPVEGVELQFTGRIGVRNANRTLRTNAQGMTELVYPGGAAIPTLRFVTRKAGYVPHNYIWNTSETTIQLPKEFEVKLEVGAIMGGRVLDAQQQPIAGATVRLSMPTTRRASESYYVSLGVLSTTSDRDGRWQFDTAPAESPNLRIAVSHPEYNAGTNVAKLGMENLITLSQGPTVRGTIVDKDGKPVSFARLRFGENRYADRRNESVSDAQGLFQLKNLPMGPSFVTVQTEVHAPQMVRMVVAELNEPLKIELEPGRVVRAQIVDVEGNPLAGVGISASSWQGMSLFDTRPTTDEQGRFEWKAAPADGVTYYISKTGYSSLNDYIIPSDGEDHKITLKPALVVRGKVTDAATGAPVSPFRLIRGQQSENVGPPYWYEDEVTQYAGGTFSAQFENSEVSWMLRVEADGYMPTESRPFKLEEGNVTFDFALKPGKGLSGVVLLSDGKPAVGAQVMVMRQGGSNNYSIIESDVGVRTIITRGVGPAAPIVTDNEGRFTLPAMAESAQYLVTVNHPTGYGDATGDELKKSAQIKLVGWGRLEGRVFVGTKPAANNQVSFQSMRGQRSNDALRSQFVNSNQQVVTDAEGRFVLERLMPGPALLSRIIVTQTENGQMHSYGWNKSVDIREGEKTDVTLGGTGRPIVGSVALDREPATPVAWSSNNTVRIMPRNRSGGAIDSNTSYVAPIDANRRFTAPDIPAGEYVATIALMEQQPPSLNDRFYSDSQAIGQGFVEFIIPEMPGGRSDEPFDLKTVTVKLHDTLDAGEVAPELSVTKTDGKPWRLSEFGQKLVLVNFLSSNSGQGVADVGTYKRIFDKYGKDPNFVMLTVWCGGETNAIRSLADTTGYKWHHAFVDGTYSRGPQRFMVRKLPATFLIGGNRKVVARDAREEDLTKSIDSLLGLGDLFALSQGDPPPRFSLKTFEAVAGGPAPAESGLVVLDDSDQQYELAFPSHDHVRMIGGDGKEVWSQEGYRSMPTQTAGDGVAVDRQRGRIYVRESSSERLSALNLKGQKLWELTGVDAAAIAVDEKTGNVWVAGGEQVGGRTNGETVVVDPDGRDVATYPFGALGLAYDAKADAFWLVGREVIKLSKSGEVLFRKPNSSWYYNGIAVNPADGSAWVLETGDASIRNSKNRLWVLNADGSPRQEIDLGKDTAVAVDYSAKDQAAWVVLANTGVRKVLADGKLSEPLLPGARNVAASAEGGVWVATEDTVIRLDAAGKEVAKSQLPSKSPQVWMVAF